ncbi:MAG: FkbM family methyltransferase [Armatimonadetes bacterium]|nr:FkbM family methyltransferase [Armatimonadota bacterium]
MKKLLRKTVKRAFNAVGLDLVRKGAGRDGMERLRQVQRLGLSPRVIFDGGAFHGLWSQEVAAIFPGARIVIAEPNPALLDTIRRNVGSIDPAPQILAVAVGGEAGRANFNIWREETNDRGASLFGNVSGKAAKVVEVEVDTLDNIARRLSLWPNLVKLDLQGGELDALTGGAEVLRRAEFVFVEFGCLEAYVGRATPREVIDLMYDSGFCLYDITDLNDRPYDGALTGGDFSFVKTTSPLRAHKGWD